MFTHRPAVPREKGRSRIGRRVRSAFVAAAAFGSAKLPETPLIIAGAFGGPLCILGLTPLRNALVLASQDSESGVVELYQRTFQGGLAAGWVGGLQAMPSACPQFVIMGPAFHLFREAFGGVVPAVCLSGICETVISYPAQSRNAQMAFNLHQELTGTDLRARLSHPIVPWGPGVLIHMTRNVLAMSGLRVLSAPIQACISKLSRGALPPALHAIVGDFTASMAVACLTMPLSQLYNFLVVSTLCEDMTTAKQVTHAVEFLSTSYLARNADGRISGLRPQVYRDAFMRMAYIATLFALFGCLERTSVALWRRWKGKAT